MSIFGTSQKHSRNNLFLNSTNKNNMNYIYSERKNMSNFGSINLSKNFNGIPTNENWIPKNINSNLTRQINISQDFKENENKDRKENNEPYKKNCFINEQLDKKNTYYMLFDKTNDSYIKNGNRNSSELNKSKNPYDRNYSHDKMINESRRTNSILASAGVFNVTNSYNLNKKEETKNFGEKKGSLINDSIRTKDILIKESILPSNHDSNKEKLWEEIKNINDSNNTYAKLVSNEVIENSNINKNKKIQNSLVVNVDLKEERNIKASNITLKGLRKNSKISLRDSLIKDSNIKKSIKRSQIGASKISNYTNKILDENIFNSTIKEKETEIEILNLFFPSLLLEVIPTFLSFLKMESELLLLYPRCVLILF